MDNVDEDENENETKTEDVDVDVDVDEVIDTVVDNDNDNDNDDGNDTDTETTNQLGKQWSGDTNKFVVEEVRKNKSIREGAAFDVIMVQDSHTGTLYENSDYLVSFKGEKETTGGTITNEDPNKIVVMEIPVVSGDTSSEKVWFQINKGGGTGSDGDTENDKRENLEALTPYLHPGRNPIRYLLLNLEQHTIVGMASANIFVYSQHDSIVVSDIDGTVTKSNAAGLLGTMGPFKETLYGKVTHEGICHLLSTLAASSKSEKGTGNGTTQVVYLTSRPTLLANQTRQFLVDLKQPATSTTTTNESIVDNESARTTANVNSNPLKAAAMSSYPKVIGSITPIANDIGLPRGPLLGFGGKVSKVLVMELISHTANEFKSKKLWQQVVQPFREANNNNDTDNENDTNHPTFVAGFGNNTRDMQAYHSIGMDLHRIYMIDKKSRIVTFDKKMEKDGNDNNDTTDPATKDTTTNHPTEFQSEQFYKDRIGTTFDEGYTDTKLLFQLGFYDHNEEKKANISKYLVKK